MERERKRRIDRWRERKRWIDRWREREVAEENPFELKFILN